MQLFENSKTTSEFLHRLGKIWERRNCNNIVDKKTRTIIDTNYEGTNFRFVFLKLPRCYWRRPNKPEYPLFRQNLSGSGARIYMSGKFLLETGSVRLMQIETFSICGLVDVWDSIQFFNNTDIKHVDQEKFLLFKITFPEFFDK